MKRYRTLSLFFFLVGLSLSPSFAEVQLSTLINDHMVFQRNEVITISGKANKESIVQVVFAEDTLTTNVINQEWVVEFPSRRAGGPYKLTIMGENQLHYEDIYIGDVFLVSGQSNMEWPTRLVQNAELELADAAYPMIRVFTVEKDLSYKKRKHLKSGKWQKVSRSVAAEFSGIGFLFARAIYKEKGIAIGVIDNAWGGSMIKTYMEEGTFYDKENYRKEISEFKSLQLSWSQIESIKSEWREGLDVADLGKRQKWFIPDTDRKDWMEAKLPGNWEKSTFPDLDGVVWYAKTFSLDKIPSTDIKLLMGRIDDEDVTYVNGYKVGSTSGYNLEREYMVPTKYLKQGENEIVVRVKDFVGGGGISGESAIFNMNIDGSIRPLAGKWLCKIGTAGYPEPPSYTHHNSFATGNTIQWSIYL